MKSFKLNREQFDYFRVGGGVRLRKRCLMTDVQRLLASRVNAFQAIQGDAVNVRFEGSLYPATVTDIYVDGGWMYAHLAPRDLLREGSKCAQALDFQRTRVRNATAAPGS